MLYDVTFARCSAQKVTSSGAIKSLENCDSDRRDRSACRYLGDSHDTLMMTVQFQGASRNTLSSPLNNYGCQGIVVDKGTRILEGSIRSYRLGLEILSLFIMKVDLALTVETVRMRDIFHTCRNEN